MAQNAPIIIIKKKAAHGGHHGGAWKVAYADFVTAMMALFIVLWLLNSSKQIKVAVGGYFKDPTGKSKKVGNGEVGSVGESFTVNKDNMDKIKDELAAAIRKVNITEKLKDQIEMTITAEGLRIELMETEKGAFFPSATKEPNDQGKELLSLLAAQLGKLPNTLSIEGHTDSKPYATSGIYSNWELSADRANSARRIMQQNGLGPNQVTQVRGYADQRLRKPQDPENPANRRISVIVHYLEKPSTDDDDESAPKEGSKEGSKEAPKEHAATAAPAAHK
jgi:chemotaxis protein MotB